MPDIKAKQAPPGAVLRAVVQSLPGVVPAEPPKDAAEFPAEPSPFAVDARRAGVEFKLSPVRAAHELKLTPFGAELLRLVHKLENEPDEMTLARAAEALRSLALGLKLSVSF